MTPTRPTPENKHLKGIKGYWWDRKSRCYYCLRPRCQFWDQMLAVGGWCGETAAESAAHCHAGLHGIGGFQDCAHNALARARLAGAEAERERCAKVAEQWANGQDSVAVLKEQDDCPASAQSHEEAAVVGRWIASAIRAIDPAAVVGGRPAPEVPRQ